MIKYDNKSPFYCHFTFIQQFTSIKERVLFCLSYVCQSAILVGVFEIIQEAEAKWQIWLMIPAFVIYFYFFNEFY